MAVKLELGTVQTLAHQDDTGAWVLNEIPDKSEELLKCCMSTADSSDTYANNKKTASTVGAVALDGSNTMTGNLNIEKSMPVLKMHNTSNDRHAWIIQSDSDHSITISNRVDDNNRSQLLINPETVSLDQALRLYRAVDGKGVSYNILHTGNKPIGSYTGNGSAAARTVEAGGLNSNALLIRNVTNGRSVIVMYAGAVALHSDGTVVGYPYGTAQYNNNILTLATADADFNANGITYTYQVL